MPCECESAIGRANDTGDLAQMVATLACYDRMFGPISMQTLSLAVLVGRTLADSGQDELGRRLLERVARDVVRAAGPTHRVRLTALASLRDLYLRFDDLDAAIRTQAELASCWLALAGPEAPETVEAKARLGSLLMQSAPPVTLSPL
jgi:hypothetical protein